MTNVSRILGTLLVCAVLQTALAQSPQQQAEDEAIRRAEKSILLRKTLESAESLQKERDLNAAAKVYDEAWALSESVGPSSEAERAIAAHGVSSVRFALANAAAKAGDFKAADAHIGRALKVDPTNAQLKNFKHENDRRLADMVGKTPSDVSLSLLPEYHTNQIKFSTMVQDSRVLMEMGKLEDAEKSLREILKQDPENQGAYYYLNLIEERKYDRLVKKRTLTSKEKLIELERAWDRPVSKLPDSNPYARTNTIHTGYGRQSIQNKLDKIILDEVKFDGLPLGEVVKWLDEQTRLRDPERKGLNFLVSSSIDAPQSTGATTIDPATGAPVAAAQAEQLDLNSITIKLTPGLKKVRLADALDAIATVADRPIKVSLLEYAIVFTQRLPEAEQLHTRQFKVDPNTFMQGLESVTGYPVGASFGNSQGGGGGGGGGGSH